MAMSSNVENASRNLEEYQLGHSRSTPTRNHPNFGTSAEVKKAVPRFANPSKSLASSDTKLNILTAELSQWMLKLAD